MSMAPKLPDPKLGEILDAALRPLYPDAVFPQLYTGPLLTYVVWNYSIINALWAEGMPQAAIYLVQVHLYCPHKENPTEAILALSAALSDAGLTMPRVTDASDSEGQHWTLECEYTDGGRIYGFA